VWTALCLIGASVGYLLILIYAPEPLPIPNVKENRSVGIQKDGPPIQDSVSPYKNS
jgi:hypothetical protein